MDPRIQYTKTTDGVNIAYSEAGEGRPLIVMPIPGFSHAELIWQMFGALHSLAAKCHVVTYDSRGNGLSDRSAVDFSMDAMMRDLEAVVARSGFESFALASMGTGAPIGLTYAATHPERVSHLFLIDGCASFSDFAESPVYKAGVPLLDADWVVFTETFAQVLYFHANPDFARQYAEYLRACCEPDAMRAVWKAWTTRDVSALLPQVAAPTLVIQNKNNRWFPVAAGQGLAAAIPGARLTLVDDMTYAAVANLIEEVVGESDAAEPKLPSGTAIILFLDIAGSTELTTRLGDAAYREKERDLDGALRDAVREAGGSPVEGKVLGDGVMAVFGSAKDAIDAALGCQSLGDDTGLPLHLGIHAGDVIREGNNVHGGAVQVAARIADASAPGEVLVSDIVRGLARTSAGVSFEDRGEHELKGVSEPVRVFAVRGE
jgi:class 3 adenylate cyclase